MNFIQELKALIKKYWFWLKGQWNLFVSKVKIKLGLVPTNYGKAVGGSAQKAPPKKKTKKKKAVKK